MGSRIGIETLLSSWIFFWAVAYLVLRSLHYPRINATLPYWNPAFALCVALFWQILAGIMIVGRLDAKVPWMLFKYAILATIFKSGPLWLTLQKPVPWLYSILAYFVVFTIYILYIQYNGLNLFAIYDDLMDSFVTDDNRVPPYRLTIDAINKIKNF